MIKLFKGKKKEETDKTFFKRLRQGLSKTRAGLTDRLDQLLLGKKEIDALLLEDLEEILFTSDLGVATTQELIQQIQERVTRKELDNPERLKEALKDQILSFLQGPPTKGKRPNPGEPLIIMVVGVNGVGTPGAGAGMGGLGPPPMNISSASSSEPKAGRPLRHTACDLPSSGLIGSESRRPAPVRCISLPTAWLPKASWSTLMVRGPSESPASAGL